MFAALAAHPWAYPMLEVVHIVGIALLLGNLLALEVRVWGGASVLSVQALARLCIGLALLGFALAAVSGSLMWATQGSELLNNRFFLSKMGLLALAGINAAWFHCRGSLQKLDAMAKASMLLSSVLWMWVLVCGRWIAYG